MGSLSLEEENIIKDIRNLFRLKKEQNYTAIKDIRNLFRQEKETKAIKDRILRDIKNLFEHEKEEEDYYKPERVSKKTCKIKCKYCDCVLKYTNVKDDLIEYKCLRCNKSYQGKFDEKLKERFSNTYKFSNHDNNNFIWLL